MTTVAVDDVALDAARRRVAAAQAELIGALTAEAPVPAGFDAERVAIAGEALRRKRARTIEERFAAYVHHHDEAHDRPFAETFVAWSRTNSLTTGGTLADLGRFDLATRGTRGHALPAGIAMLAVDARLAAGRRWVTVRCTDARTMRAVRLRDRIIRRGGPRR